MSIRHLFACIALVAIVPLGIVGCAVSPEDAEETDVAIADEEGNISEAAQALTWYCEGWTPDLYQYCLTKCERSPVSGQRYAVGSESTIAYGACNTEAAKFCQKNGWGVQYAACWGYYY